MTVPEFLALCREGKPEAAALLRAANQLTEG